MQNFNQTASFLAKATIVWCLCSNNGKLFIDSSYPKFLLTSIPSLSKQFRDIPENLNPEFNLVGSSLRTMNQIQTKRGTMSQERQYSEVNRLTLSRQQQPSALPPAAQCYFDSVVEGNAEALSNCFTPDGVVIDVNRSIEGRSAIRTWAQNEVVGGIYEIIEVKPTLTGVSVLLTFAPNRSSGFKARYDFQIQDGLIVKADLQYA